MKKIPVTQLSSTQQGSATNERFKIRRVEDIMGDSGLVQDRHRHDFYLILALQNGTGHHEIDFTSYKVQGNSVFFIRRGQVHQLELTSGCTGCPVEFNKEFCQPRDKSSHQRLRRANNKNHCGPDNNRFTRLQAILYSMWQGYNARKEGFQDVIK